MRLCGVSIDIISLDKFEIDHIIPKKAERFEKSKANAGYIENLALSCYTCNRFKSNWECTAEELHKINPDGSDITQAFVRDELYCIQIRDSMKDDSTVNSFYTKVALDNPLRRVDYLLMNMIGLSRKITSENPAYGKLVEAIELLRSKRNLMS